MKTFIVINGYGVPVDIMTDRSYHSYLGQVLNYLWDHYRSTSLTIITAGGNTDMVKPYRRTEAGEMAKWLAPRIKSLHRSKQWKIRTIVSSLNALDTLLAAQRIVGVNKLIYCCEKTREQKSNMLVKKLFGSRGSVLAFDFDTSKPRYDTVTRKAMEREDMQYCLRALKDPQWAAKLRAANRMKIEVLRTTSAATRAISIDTITRQLRKEYLRRK